VIKYDRLGDDCGLRVHLYEVLARARPWKVRTALRASLCSCRPM
jgi:hypothetical protein